jgi:tRNA-splicing ligase RtcB
MTNYDVIDSAAVPIKCWTRGVPVEDVALTQLRNVAALPFIYRHVAVMPDVHWGVGATVGSVIATRGAVVPAAVGVDIGCGMVAARLSLTASDLPDNLSGIRSSIEANIPHGRTANGGVNDRGAWGNELPKAVLGAWSPTCYHRLRNIVAKHPKLLSSAERAPHHLGTLGTGNHFVELCLDEDQRVWLMLHSGSRGIGNAIGRYFIDRAKEHMRRWFISLPDADLAYLPENTSDFDHYMEAVGWAQDFAAANRQIMLMAAFQAVVGILQRPDIIFTEEAINCHHNYVSRENHFKANVLVTRKGAVRAREGDLGIIPGSMGTRSYIVRGRGNPDSFTSCAHGAGRAMGRREAERRFTLDDHAAATAGVECRKDAGVLDETPGAYKDIDAVMAAQTDLVEIVHTLKQVVCVKG